MKYSVFTVSTPDLTPDALCAEAQAAGLHGIEWRCKETPEALRSEPPSFWGNNRCTIAPDIAPDEIAGIRENAERHGLRNIALVPYLTCGDVAGTERLFRLARTLGAEMIRVGVPGYDPIVGYERQLASAYAYLDEVDALARSYGVKALAEIHHGTIIPSASAAHRLVSRYSPDRIGVLLDPGNMVHEGMENYRMGMEILGPYLAHVHVKNAGWHLSGAGTDGRGHPNAAHAAGDGNGAEPAPLDPIAWQCSWRPIASGIVPWKQVLAALKAVGYDGWLGLEDFSRTYDSGNMMRTFVRQMRTWEDELQ
ncbi:sugar phosphate isomerase/epimerase family protein [Cohnella nanjingensis]|uniref:Sugar phosphate isomerase/epimerase n=1 Tax=Cohnella nanjingensis TaxID=1387779 RepID=A0A7X0RTR9_9BACL|nr:sugar phosphate isomerase/epimerase family protein [Cohnella nanjingensis]MBB6673393.1 sugar phosphate isomerase/epimerase [Cohnella nanjingensis]